MVKVPPALQPVPPVTAQVPMMEPPLITLVVVFNVPVTDVLVRVRVFPPDTTTKDKVPVTVPAELAVRSNVPLGDAPVTGKHPPSI